MINYSVIFPGQGSQKTGMLSELFKQYKIVKLIFEEASEILRYNLWNLIQDKSSKKINKTLYAQPALLSASVSIWSIWKEIVNVPPKILAGHSLGEYSALVCAESINFSDAIKLVKLRGEFMQETISPKESAMLAVVGIKKKIVISICSKISNKEIVSVASFNSPNQTVIAGNKNAVQRVNNICKKIGAKYTKFLPISIPSHCILMKPAAEKLSHIINKISFHTPKIPVVSSKSIRIENDPSKIQKYLIQQLYSPIRWENILKYITNFGVKILLEAGPGKILSRINLENEKNLICFSINDLSSLRRAKKIFSNN